MKLGLGQTQIQTHGSRTKQKRARHKNCRSCGSTNLVSAGPDQFCCDCDWHTCFEYVDKGYMNNLHYAYCEHFSKKNPAKLKVADLPKGNAPIGSDAIVATKESDEKKSA